MSNATCIYVVAIRASTEVYIRAWIIWGNEMASRFFTIEIRNIQQIFTNLILPPSRHIALSQVLSILTLFQTLSAVRTISRCEEGCGLLYLSMTIGCRRSLNSSLVAAAVHVASLSIGLPLAQTLGGRVGYRSVGSGCGLGPTPPTGRRYNTGINIPENVAAKIGRDLHRKPGHPLCMIKNRIATYFRTPTWKNSLKSTDDLPSFSLFDNLSPQVLTKSNFDGLLIPLNHPSRSLSDTYYLDKNTVLRTHTSAHQIELLKSGAREFIACGDCYRKDEIDRNHYPVFHQIEGVRIIDDAILNSFSPKERVNMVQEDLKAALEGLVVFLFGDVELRWSPDYFPFTDPSLELEVKFRGEWVEVLGCGVIHKGVMKNAGLEDMTGWAFGLGLERLAMILYSVPDIRLFWSEDPRFHSQFEGTADDHVITFSPYSIYPPCFKDVSFWLPDTPGSTFSHNDVHEIVRSIAGDLVEQVKILDSFQHPKTNRLSQCYRITYRSMDSSLSNAEVDKLQSMVRDELATKTGVELR